MRDEWGRRENSVWGNCWRLGPDKCPIVISLSSWETPAVRQVAMGVAAICLDTEAF